MKNIFVTTLCTDWKAVLNRRLHDHSLRPTRAPKAAQLVTSLDDQPIHLTEQLGGQPGDIADHGASGSVGTIPNLANAEHPAYVDVATGQLMDVVIVAAESPFQEGEDKDFPEGKAGSTAIPITYPRTGCAGLSIIRFGGAVIGFLFVHEEMALQKAEDLFAELGIGIDRLTTPEDGGNVVTGSATQFDLLDRSGTRTERKSLESSHGKTDSQYTQTKSWAQAGFSGLIRRNSDLTVW